jgi:hypothetical protein
MSKTNLITNMTSLITTIMNSIEPTSNSLFIKNISEKDLRDIEYMSEVFCNDHGVFKLDSNKVPSCDCDIGFFTTHCSVPGAQYWGQGWTAIQVLLGIFYVVLAALTWYYLHYYMKSEFGSFWKKIKRLCYTPKYLVILNLLYICNSKYT